MRILVIIHNQINTGPYFKVLEMCQVLVERNNIVYLYCTSNNARFRINNAKEKGVNIVIFPDLLIGNLRQGIDIWNLVNRTLHSFKIDFDLVQIIDCRPNVILPALIIKKLRKIPIVINWWDHFGSGGTALSRSGKLYNATFGKIETFFEEHFRKYADFSFVVSYSLKKKLVSLNYPQDKIAISRVGAFSIVNYDKFKVRQELYLPLDVKIFCFTGVLFADDLILLISSLKILKSKILKMPITILTGEHKLSDDLCAELNIKLTGRIKLIDDVRKYIRASDFALIPMRKTIANLGRWPSKISDYFAINKPIITTPVSDLEELFGKYDLGVISKSDSIQDYAAVLFDSLQLSQNKIRHMESSVSIFFEDELNWYQIVDRKLNVYKSLL